MPYSVLSKQKSVTILFDLYQDVSLMLPSTNTASIPFYTPMSNPSQNPPLLTHHGNVVVALNNLSDFSHFLLHIAGPDFTDDLTGVCKCSWHVGRSGSERENPNNPAALNKGTQ